MGATAREVHRVWGDGSEYTELFACRFRWEGLETRRYGRLPACGGVLCPRCLEKGVPTGAHPSRPGRQQVALTSMHARVASASRMCVQCRWRLCTGVGLDVTDADDLYVVELIPRCSLICIDI
jgi:hypothetical protein